MSPNQRHADYDRIAHAYEKRYERNNYAGVEQALRQFIGSRHELGILEVGCGTGHWLEVLQESQRRLIGFDFSTQMLALALRRLPGIDLIRGTAECLPFPSKSFDRVFCINAIHHFPDKPAFLREARRLLRSGGRLLSVGLDPHRGIDQWHIYDYFKGSLDTDRQRFLSSEMLREQLREAGFENCVTREVEHWIIRLPAREALEQGRLDKAANSQLSMLTDAEYQQGMQQIREDIERAEAQGETLFLTVDLRLYGTTGSVAD